MDFSLEGATSRIYDDRTKSYFKEVLTSYQQGNFRATIVMLYSVVICDLVYKLQRLKEIYNDEKAIKILTEIEKSKEKKKKSSDWENELVNLIEEKGVLIEHSTVENIRMLQKHRHLCAHPVLNSHYELYDPKKDLARSHLRNMLEELLIRPPFIANSIFKDFIKDISEKRQVFPNPISAASDEKDLEKFLKAKYFKHLSQKGIEYFFGNLWKLTFRLIDVECEENRSINYRIIKVLIKNYQSTLEKLIAENSSYYSNITQGSPARYLIGLLSTYPFLFKYLEDHAEAIIDFEINSSIEGKIVSWFKFERMNDYVIALASSIKADEEDFKPSDIRLKYLGKVVYDTEKFDKHDLVLKFCIDLYTGSKSFIEARTIFSELISIILQVMEENHVIMLLSGIEKNDQTYKRWGTSKDHGQIIGLIDAKRMKSINLDDYPKFKDSSKPKVEDDDLPF